LIYPCYVSYWVSPVLRGRIPPPSQALVAGNVPTGGGCPDTSGTLSASFPEYLSGCTGIRTWWLFPNPGRFIPGDIREVKLDVYDDIIVLTVPGRNAKAVFGGDLPKEEEQ
jgi:hypothetical protein